MRRLTEKQKKLLRNYPEVNGVDELPWAAWEEIQEINDYETLWQDANRFLWDQWSNQSCR